MKSIGIAELNKNPTILDLVDGVAMIVNKKNRHIKGYFIPATYKNEIEKVLKDIEYKKFLQRNKSLLKQDNEDDTVMDGIDEMH